MVILDASVVNVALPTIKGDLEFSEQNLSCMAFPCDHQLGDGPMPKLAQIH